MGELEQPSVQPGEIRVSDKERDAVLGLLGQHAAAGRLTLDEHEERAAKALVSRTRDDLAALTRDLPEQPSVPAGRRKPTRWLVAVMGGSHRRGRYRLATTVNAIAVMGGDDIDLRDAEIDSDGIVLNAISIMGGPNIYLPDTVDAEVGGLSIMGGNVEYGAARPRPGAPVVRIRTYNLMGGASIWLLPPEARGLPLQEARRLAKAAGRGELRGPDHGSDSL